MTYTDNYLDATADGISEMHVIVEGAIAIFEIDVDPLIRLSTQHKEYEARMPVAKVAAHVAGGGAKVCCDGSGGAFTSFGHHWDKPSAGYAAAFASKIRR